MRGSNPGRSKRFSVIQKFKPALCSEVPGFFHGVKWPRREVNNPPPPRAEVKNVWNHTSNPPIGPYGVGGKNLSFYILECLEPRRTQSA